MRQSAFCILAGSFALFIAILAQYVLHMTPCALCLIERRPYEIMVLFGVMSYAITPKAKQILSYGYKLCALAAIFISLLHVGVEYHWWPDPIPACSSVFHLQKDIMTTLATLPTTPAKPCDAPDYLLSGLPLSFTTLDLIYGISILVILCLIDKKEDDLSQLADYT
jgi:disulfide bond formation protein DsbB